MPRQNRSIGLSVLGALFFAQGLGKLVDLRGYALALQAFQPESFVGPVAIVWTSAELFAGALQLYAARDVRARSGAAFLGLIVAVVVSFFYLTMIASALAHRLTIANCTCFGAFLPQHLSLWVLAQELAALGSLTWQLVDVSRRRSFA